MILDTIHSLINIFAGGRSEIRIFLFVLYFVTLIAIYFFTRKNNFLKNLKWRWFGINLLISYLYGLFLQILYIASYNLSLTDFFITGNNGEISSSTIWHTHIAKGSIGQIFSLLGKTNLETMDAGGAYIGLIPSGILLIGSILLMTLILQTIFYFSTFLKQFFYDKNTRQKIFLFLGYAVITFSLIKTSIDGGIFNPSFGISIIFIILFIFREKGKSITNYYYLISVLAITLLSTSLYIESFIYESSLTAAQIATLSLLYAIFLYGSEKEIRLQFFIPLLILFMTGWYVASVRDRNIFNYAQTLLSTGQEIYIYNEKEREVKQLKVEKTVTIRQLSKQLNKNVTYMPIAVPGVTCMEKAPPQELSLTLISLNPIHQNTFTSSKFIKIKNKDSVAFGNKWQTLLSLYTTPCLPEPLSVIDGELEKNDIHSYLLIDITKQE